MNKRIIGVRKLLEVYGQAHLLMKYDEMDQQKQEQLLDMIESIDFELIQKLFNQATASVIEEQVKVEPAEYLDKKRLTGQDIKLYEELGERTIRAGEVAVVTMAGGQGTRLGFDGPKGAFIFDEESGKSIFEALTDTLLDVCRKYNVNIPWFIMTSHENNSATIRFFEEHNYFGYSKEAINFFIQDELPMLDLNGKILLDSDFMVKKAANGHGGTLYSMKKSGVIQKMKDMGVQYVSINGVDNVLVKPVDPLFIGYAISKHSEVATKSIAKVSAEEKVGVLCLKNGRIGVVEYTEISNHMANLRDSEGELIYGNAYALFNLFSIHALETVAEASLPYHVAVKKADYYDHEGKYVVAKAPNAYKFEQFLFDAFEFFDKGSVQILRIIRDEEFAPIKNATGKDSPETALNLYRKYHA